MPPNAAPGVRRGAFVTLQADGVLRGCIGHVAPDRLLAQVVRDMTVAAARNDARFPPVAADEVPAIRIQISVLTEPAPLDPVEAGRIAVGRDGLLVRRGRAMGLLLPQVAAQQHFGPEAFLAAACRKAGLRARAWREPGTRVFTFRADIFGE